MPIKTAVIFFPFLAILLTIPFAIFQYRKYGYINKLRVLLVFSFLFYLISAYYMVILPLPKDRDVKSSQREDIEYTNLKPFEFIEDIKRETRVDFDNPNTFKYLLTERAFLQAIFNVLLTLPLGIYLRYYFGRSLLDTITISFLASLFFELTQLSGLYGIYNAPYRVFDVDDLILNTLGGSIGYIIAPMFTFFLPKAEQLDEGVELETMRVSFPRRFLAYVIDMILLGLIPNYNSDIRVQYGAIFIYFIIITYMSNGRTIGHWITNTRVKGEGERIRFKEVLIRNGILFFGVIGLNRFFLELIELNQGTDLYYLALFIALFQLAYLLYLIGNFLSTIFKRDRFFYEKLSGTRIAIVDRDSSLDGVEEVDKEDLYGKEKIEDKNTEDKIIKEENTEDEKDK